MIRRTDMEDVNEWSNFTNWNQESIPPYSNGYFNPHGSALTIDASGNITKIGQSTADTGKFLKWDGSNAVWDTAGGTITELNNQTEIRSNQNIKVGFSLEDAHKIARTRGNKPYIITMLNSDRLQSELTGTR